MLTRKRMISKSTNGCKKNKAKNMWFFFLPKPLVNLIPIISNFSLIYAAI